MPLVPPPFRLLSPSESVRWALIRSLYQAHRPEFADLVESAGLILDWPGIWLRPTDSFAQLRPETIEAVLLEASIEAGLPLEWIRLLGTRTYAAA
jgi:hypothetical protein